MIAFGKIDNFFSQFKSFRYKKGEVILRPFDTPQGVYFLEKGFVRLYTISQDGKELTLIIFKPNDFFPIGWAINNTPNTQYLETMTDALLWRAPKEEFIRFVQENPDAFFELTSKMLVRLGGILERMEYLAFGNAYSKVASILTICAERFGEKEGKNLVIQVPLTHKDVANLVGITRETASIEIKKLERKGLLTYHGRHLIISDLEKLQKESLK